MFDLNILKSHQFSIPVISVGNLSTGGTGKTPTVEYLVRLLSKDHRLAVLSRGYKRKTKGFFIAGPDTDEKIIGDEARQMAAKFDDLTIAVSESRVKGIQQVIKQRPETDMIILDDAFQHRYVKPGLSILLTDFHKLYPEDFVLPSGSLREFASGANRADLIIVTKTPKPLSPLTRRRINDLLKPGTHQKLFFSYITYGAPVPLPVCKINAPPKKNYNYILLFSGIANSYPLQEHLGTLCHDLTSIEFPDHHRYTRKDIEKILSEFDRMFAKDKVIFTTEKDAVRLNDPELSGLLEGFPVFYIPIKMEFHHCDDARFDKEILKYVEAAEGNSRSS